MCTPKCARMVRLWQLWENSKQLQVRELPVQSHELVCCYISVSVVVSEMCCVKYCDRREAMFDAPSRSGQVFALVHQHCVQDFTRNLKPLFVVPRKEQSYFVCMACGGRHPCGVFLGLCSWAGGGGGRFLKGGRVFCAFGVLWHVG